MTKIRMEAAALAYLMFVTTVLNLVTIAEAANPIPIPGGQGYIEKFSGTMDKLGGGDYVGIRFMRKVAGAESFVEDAKFAVLYGTQNQPIPNSIVIFGEMTRYLGAAKVYDTTGGLISNRYPIAIKTIWIQKLEDIFEYYDVDGDGTCNYSRNYNGLLYSDYLWHEPIYKKVSLRTAWTRSAVNETLDPNGLSGSWNFSLTATDLSYKNITGLGLGIGNPVGDGKLNKVQFTFHLQARLVNLTNGVIPLYNVTVDASQNYKVVGSQKIQNIVFNGSRIDYTVKYDQEITGWDYDSSNPNKHLLLEWHAVVGNFIPERLAEWLKEQFVSSINGGTCNLQADTPAGNVTLNEANANATTSRPSLMRILKPRRIHLGDNWQNVGGLTWVTDVNVTQNEGDQPVQLNMTAQIQGHKRISVDLGIGVFNGFAVLGGFSYPGGYTVYHDPGMGASSTLANISEISTTPSVNYLPYVAIGIAIVLIVVGSAVLIKHRKPKENLTQ